MRAAPRILGGGQPVIQKKNSFSRSGKVARSPQRNGSNTLPLEASQNKRVGSEDEENVLEEIKMMLAKAISRIKSLGLFIEKTPNTKTEIKNVDKDIGWQLDCILNRF